MRCHTITCRYLLRIFQQRSYSVSSANKETTPKSINDIPGPPRFLSLQMKPFGNHNQNRFDKLLRDCNEKYGDIVLLRIFGTFKVVCLFDPDDISHVFRLEGKYPMRPTSMLLLTYQKRRKSPPSMSTAQGEEWHKMRSLVQVPFRRQRNVDKFVPKISVVADDFVARFERTLIMESLPYCCLEFTTEGMGSICFDKRLGIIGTDAKNTELVGSVVELFEMMGKNVFSFPWYVFFRTSQYNRFEKAIDTIAGYTQRYIEEAFARAKENKGESDSTEANLVIDMLSVPNTTHELVAINIAGLFIAGIDSSAQAMTFLLYQLAKNPNEQEKLFKELEEHIQPSGPIDADTINKLTYLKACLKESFRLVFPIMIGTARTLSVDTEIKGYHIPKNVMFMLANPVIGQNEKYFPEAKMFKPERWLRTQEAYDIPRFSQLPFGFGPRNCVGQRFAELEIYVCVAKMVRNYKLSLPPGLKEVRYIYTSFATPEDPFDIMLEKRV